MKKFLQKMIIPTAIMIWATWYFFSVSKMKKLDSVLIRPIYFILAALFVVNAISDYIEAKKETEAEKKSAPENEEKKTFKEILKCFVQSSAFRIVLIFVLIMLYALLLKKVGFIIVNTLFVLGVLLIMGERKVWKLIVIPIVVTAAMYAIFVLGLKILLPKGILKGIL